MFGSMLHKKVEERQSLETNDEESSFEWVAVYCQVVGPALLFAQIISEDGQKSIRFHSQLF